MHALDCIHEGHEDMHISANDDAELLAMAMQHRDEYHPEMSDDQIREIVTAGAYDE
jgi:hypothetical protein